MVQRSRAAIPLISYCHVEFPPKCIDILRILHHYDIHPVFESQPFSNRVPHLIKGFLREL